MSLELALWIVLSGLALMFAALFATILARSMEAGRTKLSLTEPEALAAILPGGPIGSLLKKHALASVLASGDADPEKAAETAKASAKRGGAVAAVAIAIALGGAGLGIASDLLKRDIDVSSLAPVEIAAGDLHGTLLSPRKRAPVVLIVPGSGPTDRDGNNPMGVKANSYKLLAEGLAAEGIATVRVDKRGMFGSAAAGDANAVTVEEYTKDYHAWIDAIRAQTGRKCVWLLGHSEGALMVSAAAQGRRDVCGLILIAGIGRRLGDVLRDQLRANPANAPLLDQAFSAIAELEAGRHPDTSAMHPALLQLFSPKVQDFLISVFAADPVDLVRRARVKTLVIQGTTDLQVSVEDARLLNEAPRTTMKLIKGMNHVLKEAPVDRAANLATYTDPSLPLDPMLVDKIEHFIEGDD